MGAGTESSVQLAAGLTGLKARTLEVTTYVGGVAVVTEQQVISIADENGQPIFLAPSEDWQFELLREMKLQTLLLLRINEGISHQHLNRQELLDLLNDDPEQENES